MRRRRRDDGQAPGEDSFLDVVANLVGILVILIMIVGMRARGAYEASSRAGQPAAPPADMARQRALDEQINESQVAIQAMQTAAKRTHQDLQRMEAEILLREVERDRLNLLLAQVEQEINERRHSLDRDKQHEADLLDQRDETAEELKKLQLQIDQLKNETPDTVVVSHVPTPLAQTVFGHEEHYRLLHGHLVYVPLNTLVETLKRDARQRSSQLKTTDELTATIGPEGGFRLRYHLARRSIEVDTKMGSQVHELAQLTEFELLPQSEEMGQPVDELLHDGSSLTGELSQWQANKTVITVWTYPDSFDEYRRLKEFLEQRGFSSAARPLPDGQLISGSPQGTHSAAQ